MGQGLVGDRASLHRDPDEVLLGSLDALADRVRHLIRLAQSNPDHAVAVAHDDHRAEAEPPSALHDLRHAIDADDLLLERQTRGINFRH
jgi:hypothetical protein